MMSPLVTLNNTSCIRPPPGQETRRNCQRVSVLLIPVSGTSGLCSSASDPSCCGDADLSGQRPGGNCPWARGGRDRENGLRSQIVCGDNREMKQVTRAVQSQTFASVTSLSCR